MDARFGRDQSDFDQRGDGEACLFAIQISDDGRPLLDTFVLSSAAWAIGRLIDPGPEHEGWLDGFESGALGQALSFAETFALLENDDLGRELNSRPYVRVGRAIQRGDLEGEIARIASELRIADVLDPKQWRIRAHQVRESNVLEAEPDDFLNSFFLQDLERLATEAAGGNLNSALSTYLASEEEAAKTESRVDVRLTVDCLWRNTAPAEFPIGRWPTDASQSLYFSQQFAVNTALEELKGNSALFGVNGPPGTGKTTMLREVIASIVVQRAQVLASLRRPEDAFSGAPGRWQSGNYTRTIYPFRNDLLGFGIVVTSSNNRAVENVTLEIPSADAISDLTSREYLAEFDHSADFGTRILNARSRQGDGSERTAWGLVAARLGNKRNRQAFVSRFWFEDKEVEEPKSRAEKGFQKHLKTVKGNSLRWKKAVQEFKQAVEQEAKLRDQRMLAWEAVERTFQLSRKLIELRAKGSEIETEIANLNSQIAKASDAKAAHDSLIEEAVQSRRRHREFRPNVLDVAITIGSAYREWRDTDSELANHIREYEERRRSILSDLSSYEMERREQHERLQDTQKKLQETQVEFDACQERIRGLRDHLGSALPNPDAWLLDPEGRELSSPWADYSWNRARNKAFIMALRLHRAFIECMADRVRRNLSGAMDILSGKVPPGVPGNLSESAWATLFFVVPVISTTFASFDRLFAHCGRDSIGYLLIDEAGQAAPQAAAGAIWRSRRVIVVGDPRQLEPIVALPFTAQQALRRHFGIAETWLPSKNSVQTLTDRMSRFGTWINAESADERVWVGSPLRVHKRCEKPMFDIANQIAYDRQMVYGTDEAPSFLPASCWIHVQASEVDEHWIAQEGAAAEMLIRRLVNQGAKPKDILLMSPFRTVAKRLREIGRKLGVPQAGTIHVSQGREADIVVFVLGGDPRRPGAKEWASDKPNLLNVAVSRAKRRLYIIGDREEWCGYPYFEDAAAAVKSGEMSGLKAWAQSV